MAILTIIGIVISLIQMILSWFKGLPQGSSPGTRQAQQLAKLRALTQQFDSCCNQYGIAPDGTVAAETPQGPDIC